jgi:hypothetical protein
MLLLFYFDISGAKCCTLVTVAECEVMLVSREDVTVR